MSLSSTSSRAAGALAVAATTTAAAAVALWIFSRTTKRRPTSRGGKDGDHKDDDDDDSCIYLDYNGTTPVYPFVVEAMLPYLQCHFGNPSSGHVYGDAPAAALQTARRQILEHLLGVSALKEQDLVVVESSIVFTSCGTESDNLAIHWALQQADDGEETEDTSSAAASPQQHHIVTCNVEHPAIELCLKASHPNVEVTYVPVGTDGRVAARDVIHAIRSNTVLVTLMLANNETGALQPVQEVAEYCRRKRILFHTDAAQAAGKVSVRLDDLGDPDLVTIVGHKIGAPKGVACLYVRPGCLDFSSDDSNNHRKLTGLLVGGGQELGRRAGTSNVPYIVGLGVAASHAAKHLARNQAHMERLRHRLRTRLIDGLGAENVRVHGPEDPQHRLPNTLSVGFAGGIHSGRLLDAVRDKVAASAGATCHSANGPVSAVLEAMQVPEEYARATVRLSLGPKTTTDEVDRAAAILIDEVKRQRRLDLGVHRTSSSGMTVNGTGYPLNEFLVGKN